MEKIIDICGISKSFDNNVIIDNFSDVIYKGELVAIVGESGKGKTTLINMIGGLDKIDTGYINVNGIKVSDSTTKQLYRNTISFLFQNFALVDEWTVEQNLEIAFKFKDVKDKKKIINNILTSLGLNDKLKNKIYSLSGGEQQRVSLARLLIQDNNVILADEPTGSLDEKNRDIVFDILLDLKEKGKTIVIVTHDNYIANKCDRIIRLS